MKEASKAKLQSFLFRQHDLAEVPTIMEIDSLRIGRACMVRIAAFGQKKNNLWWHADAYFAPETNILSQTIFDVSKSAAEQERVRNQALSSFLVRGASPKVVPKAGEVILTVVVDLECIYCADLYKILRTDVLSRSSVPVRLNLLLFPLPRSKWSVIGSAAVACVSLQAEVAGQILADRLFARQPGLSLENVSDVIEAELKNLPAVDRARFKSCIVSGKGQAIVEENVITARAAGVNATPTVFVNAARVDHVENAVHLLTLINQQKR